MSVLTHLTEWCDGILSIPDPFPRILFPIAAAAVNSIPKYTAESGNLLPSVEGLIPGGIASGTIPGV